MVFRGAGRLRTFAWGMLAASLLVVQGCSAETRYRILSRIFEGVPEPGQEQPAEPVVHQPRRPPPYPPEKATVEIVVDPEALRRQELFYRDWKAFLRKLPKDATGAIDWVRAIETGAINPASSLQPDAPPMPVFPLDVELEPKAMPMFHVTFPHKAHTEWLSCNNCHPTIFQMKAGADDIHMAQIFAGQYCGTCHGKVAFAVNTGCPRCHRKLGTPE